MTKDHSRKLSKAFVLIAVIQIHISKWEVITWIVCRSRTPRKMRTVAILPQVIHWQFHFGEWEAAAVWVYGRLGGVGIFKFVLIIPQAMPSLLALRLMGYRTTSTTRRSVRWRRYQVVPGEEQSHWNIHWFPSNYTRATLLYIVIYDEKKNYLFTIEAVGVSSSNPNFFKVQVTSSRSHHNYLYPVPR